MKTKPPAHLAITIAPSLSPELNLVYAWIAPIIPMIAATAIINVEALSNIFLTSLVAVSKAPAASPAANTLLIKHVAVATYINNLCFMLEIFR